MELGFSTSFHAIGNNINQNIMNVNFKREFVDCFGKPITEKVKDFTAPNGEKEVPLSVWEKLARLLFNLSSMSGRPIDEKLKFQAYKLSCRIAKKPADVELSFEEAVFIKEVACEYLSAGAYGYVVEIIEGKIV